jgi:predicted glycogen debranching enzyme
VHSLALLDKLAGMSLYSIETHGQLQPHLSQEWLLTNGLGGFASGTIVGCNTRRYHGLLCAATNPPVGRMMLLNRIGEILKLDGCADLLELSINQFRNSLHPRGDKYLRRFELGNTAKWFYEVQGVKVTKEVQILWQQNATAIRYTIDPGAHSVELNLLPFVSIRDFHAERHKDWVQFETGQGEHHVWVRDGDNRVWLRCNEMQYKHEPDWWTGHVYPIETERGQDDIEDLFKPGMFVATITRPTTITLVAAMNDIDSLDWDAELSHRPVPSKNAERSMTLRRLHHAANDFIVARRCPDGTPGKTVIAGYPWFADWGRDTMISLPGLFLTTGRFEEAGKVLSTFANYVSEGMIPNRFDDYTNEPHYNTVDASLWFIHAVFEFRRTSGDQNTFEQTLLPACRKIIEGHTRGTRFNIRMDPADGLITQGDHTTQLTWMDAKMGDTVFTPRHGKAVEINALWYHALVLMGERDLAAKVKASFAKAFWISPFRGLADVIEGTRRDASIRPNQIFAASLPNSPLNEEQQRAVVEVVRRELLTPMGLRTLAMSDPKFCPRYAGEQRSRDCAYHNGTVWAWLIGGFLDAYLRVNKRSTESIAQAKVWLNPLIDHMNSSGCVGSISEIFEADPPHRPVGCFAQAWSVAEVLRLAAELGM